MFDSGDTAWMLVSTSLVLFMTPGLALFYGGMVRSKHVLAMLMQNFVAMGVIAVLWVAIGFSLSFGRAYDAGWIGNFDFALFKDVSGFTSGPAVFGLSIPFVLFACYQMTFAIITPALITGATADRLRFGPYIALISAWLVLVYSPVAHWVFAGGWLAHMGALDFAGGAVVHINAGAAALAVVLVIGVRRGHGTDAMPPHNLPLTLIGTGILWFGWAGFNAGSALHADGLAAQALTNTFLAASAAMLGWLVVEKVRDGHPSSLGAASGAVAGLVAITPCAGFVDSRSSIIIGFLAGGLCLLAIGMKRRWGYDDALDVVGVHLVGGLAGSILLGFFAETNVNPIVTNRGLLMGGGGELLKDQVVASLVTLVFSFVATFAIAKVIDKAMGLRVTPEQELAGLDQALHHETAYQLNAELI